MSTTRAPALIKTLQSLHRLHRNSHHAAVAFAQLRSASSSHDVPKVQGTPIARVRRSQPSPRTRKIETRQADPASTPSVRSPVGSPVAEADLPILQARVNEVLRSIVSDTDTTNSIPSEEVVLKVLREYESIAHQIVDKKDASAQAETQASEATATSALLQAMNKRQARPAMTKADLLSNISRQALNIIEHPATFVTPAVLKSYVSLQSLLGRPESFETVLTLYRTKPTPRPSGHSGSLTFSTPNADSPSVAVPPSTADAALTAAIDAHNLPLALAIINNTYCTTAYKRSKFLRSALFPLAGALLTPLAAYSVASQYSLLQSTMDPSSATGIAMAGILTYTTTVGTIGYVALTTANDQMVRVTWATGLPLWERWIREEERAAVDRVAQAWGFRSVDRWGEEEGTEWEELREWLGIRGMVLDRVELMEGME